MTKSLFFPYLAGPTGPSSPGIKWTDGTTLNTAYLNFDGNGPNGLSYQGTANWPCLIVRAVTTDGSSGVAMARMCADGSIVGSTKSFEEPFPGRPGQVIVYTSLEGPEAGMYFRGSLRVGAAPAVIELPEHFSAIVASETVTASVTPVGRCPGGVYVASRDGRRLVVARSSPDPGTCECDFLVFGNRARHRDYSAVRDR
jgi:hypothetical protein